MESLKKVKDEPITITLTLGEADALVAAAQQMHERSMHLVSQRLEADELSDLIVALQKLDEAVNL